MVQLISILAGESDNARTFTAILDAGGRRYQLPLTPYLLCHYIPFVYAALLATGQMFVDCTCDGRSEPEADERWRLRVVILLERAAAASTDKTLN